MLFHELEFLFLFLPVTYAVFWMLRTKRQRHVWLTITGYVFYGAWNYKFCALMALSTAVSYGAGLGLLAWQDARRRRLCLVVPIAIDLLLLGTFKYAGFLFESANSLAGWLGLSQRLPLLSIVLPVGISFYTFHTITYIVDGYRRVITPTRDLFEFACYVSLFSQLVAGPIVRFREVERDLANLGGADRRRGLDLGWSFFCLGLAKKVLLADTIAAVIDPALSHHAALGTAGAWLCMLGFAYQAYYDFSGYSDMAVGLGHLFGIRLPKNFDSPYKALDPADFWRRWHISLSSFLRDYVYIPLGGSRNGAWRTARNAMITMVLAGLWHGAAWTMVIWGTYHGLLLVLHGIFAEPWARLPAALRRAATFFLMVVGLVWFRAEDTRMAVDMLGSMFVWRAQPVPVATGALLAALLVAAGLAHAAPNTWQIRHQWKPAAALALTGLFLACLLHAHAAESSPFLYFQF